MNRATADNQSAQAEEEGLEPTKEWVKDLIDEILAEEFASPDLELAWLDEDEPTPKARRRILEARVKIGAVTLNELRDALGLDPYANAAADRPMVLTATGYVPIEANDAGQGVEAQGVPKNAGQQNTPHVQKYSIDQPLAFGAASEGDKGSLAKASPDDPEHPGWPAKTPGGLGGKFRPKEGGEFAGEKAGGPAVEDGEQTRYNFPPRRGRGHTWMPYGVYKKYNWQDETRKVFRNWTSGPLADRTVNYNTAEHIEYNEAADEILKGYLEKNGITSEQASPAQAREMIEEVLGSKDPRIAVLRRQIIREAQRYFRVYGVGRWRGGDEE